MSGRWDRNYWSYDPDGHLRRSLLAEDARKIVEKHLKRTAEMFEADWDESLEGTTFRDAIRLPDGATVTAALAFHDAWSRGDCDRDDVACKVRALEERLRASFADVGRIPADLSDRRERCLGLAMWLTYCFIPAVAWLGQFSIAVEAAGAYFTLISDKVHASVIGAGNPGLGEDRRMLLLMPVLWSLALHHS